MSRGSSRGLSSTTSPTPRVRMPRHVARLVVDYFAYVARPGASACRMARCRLLRLRRTSGCLGMSRASSSTTLPRPARHRLLRLRRASGRLGTSCGSSSTTSPTSRGSSRGSSSTTLPTPCDQVPRLIARLVVDLRLRRASGCLGSSHGSSSIMRRLAARLLVGLSH
jgi:hypothetical protein